MQNNDAHAHINALRTELATATQHALTATEATELRAEELHQQRMEQAQQQMA